MPRSDVMTCGTSLSSLLAWHNVKRCPSELFSLELVHFALLPTRSSLQLLLLLSTSALFPQTSQSSHMASHGIEQGPAKRMSSSSTKSFTNEKPHVEDGVLTEPVDGGGVEGDRRKVIYNKWRPYILGFFAMVILGWWISATILKATRHRW